MLGALGVVYGDIGTSPLYAMHAALGEVPQLDAAAVYGITSTVVWTLMLVVTLLYVTLVLRVDNEGEGGLLALVALIRRSAKGRLRTVVTVAGMVGAALFLGDSVITPAISVLSAAEGLEVVDPGLDRFVVPAAMTILLGVFVLQRWGSGGVGRIYGPVMLVWFLVLAVTGGASLVQHPEALQALSPVWAVRFFLDDPLVAFLSLGSVVLVVSGAEALYADLGHFGRRAVTRSWLLLVMPALVLAYLGEAGAVLADPAAAGDPFYAVVPGWASIPMLVLGALATIIASEAVIAGAFTVLHQLGGLGLLPTLFTRHTSERQGGQIYVPAANWVLAAAVLTVVALFRSSERLASAYGLAVSGTIVVTVLLYILHERLLARRLRIRALAALSLSVLVVALFAACLPKVVTGGWLPILIGAALLTGMWTWVTGNRRMDASRREVEMPLEEVLERLDSEDGDIHRVDGSAVFLTADKGVAPLALSTVLTDTRVLHRDVVLLSWRVEDTPRAPARRVSAAVSEDGPGAAGIRSVDVVLGYRERLDAARVLENAAEDHPEALDGVDLEGAFWFVSETIPLPSRKSGMVRWRQLLYLAMTRLSTDRVAQLRVPRDRAIVIGREFRL
jgi:KUP system potassium uptake protein